MHPKQSLLKGPSISACSSRVTSQSQFHSWVQRSLAGHSLSVIRISIDPSSAIKEWRWCSDKLGTPASDLKVGLQDHRFLVCFDECGMVSKNSRRGADGTEFDLSHHHESFFLVIQGLRGPTECWEGMKAQYSRGPGFQQQAVTVLLVFS